MIYYMDPFGCVKNNVDAENMMATLNQAGWASTDDAVDADLIIINSCGFIESAKQESINAVLAWRKLYPGKKILLAGCLAQRYAKELAESLPEADGLFGNSDLAGIIQAAEKAAAVFGKSVSPEKAHVNVSTGERPLLSLPGSAYVKISEGCDNRCSYCAIPLIRGGLRSRDVADIVKECKTLLGRGIKELCLVGQDTGSYGRDLGEKAEKLPGLLEAISQIQGDFRVRLLYLHPEHFPMEILDVMRRDKRFIPYFDIPLQHLSEKILKQMNRKGNASVFLSLIEEIRKFFPDSAIRSTFLTGFPGETEEDFEQLLDFQQKARLDWLGCFAYSREEDTPAWDMKGRVAKKTAEKRKSIIEERQIPITEQRMERFVGRVFDVLVEEKFEAIEGDTASGEENLYLGRLPCHAPEVDGSAVILSSKPLECGTLVPGKVFGRSGFDLKVRPVTPTDSL